ncbi:MAG: tyrosine--tRNA ligase [bacterium]|nr:tyrosine--tRNA ligase [bacterium]
MSNIALSQVLRARGYVYQHSSEKLEEITDGAKRTLYLGIDPSADSLHVGQLQAFLILRRFLEDGHKLILLIGGATGMIGDPSGKSAERVLQDEKTVARNAEIISAQVKTLLGSGDFTILDNSQWLSELKLIDFLRDAGKHFSVNAMLQRDFIKERITNVEEGISYTEFSYALLQAYDYWHLHKSYQCDLQVGGSDQWGNIVSGIDFIRRKEGKIVFGLTWPLLVDKSGKKFGKSEQGTIWLDPAKTSPFQFYQFWINIPDDAVQEYLLKMTTVSDSEIRMLMTEHKKNPGSRKAQKRLAHEATKLAHGADIAKIVEDVSSVLFGKKEAKELSAAEREMLQKEAPSCEVRLGETLLDILIKTKLATSRSQARQFIEDNAVAVNGGTVSLIDRVIMHEDFQDAPIATLTRGKRNAVVLTLG